MKIKICGLKFQDNMDEVALLNPDYMGFIFHKPSPRYMGESLSPALFDAISRKTKKVAVFVNEYENKVLEIVQNNKFDAVQLHGNESFEYCSHIKNKGIEVIKAFRIDENFNFESTKQFQFCCNYFLFDTNTSAFGGSGQKFNWDILQNYNGTTPVFLSGGIGPDDADLINNLNFLPIYAIDINSRFEILPGFKNVELIQQFVSKLKK